MKRYRLLLLLLLPLALGAAQEPDDEELIDAAEIEEQTEANPPETADADANEAASEAADEEQEEAEAAANAGERIRDSDDFVPSVQISEDLSVSFPTDI